MKIKNENVFFFMQPAQSAAIRAVTLVCAAILSLTVFCGPSVYGAETIIRGSVPKITSSLTPMGALPATNQLWLAIGLPLRNQTALSNFLAQLYDPGSPGYRQYLARDEFVARFGPTEQDYQSVINFAEANGLNVVGTHSNRLVLDVVGTVANVEKAFGVKMLVFQHPTEPRTFMLQISRRQWKLPCLCLELKDSTTTPCLIPPAIFGQAPV
jgi:subtilase family serine protease